MHVSVDDVSRNVNAFFSEYFLLTWLPFSADSAAMVCSAQKVKVAVKSAKIGASSHVTNSILKNAAKWLGRVYSVDWIAGLAVGPLRRKY